MGISNKATTRESNSVVTIDTPTCSPMSLRKKSSENRKGKKTVIVVIVAAMTALATSLVPCTAASWLGVPIARRRKIFSMTTIELSSSMPTARAIPVSVRVLILMPKKLKK